MQSRTGGLSHRDCWCLKYFIIRSVLVQGIVFIGDGSLILCQQQTRIWKQVEWRNERTTPLWQLISLLARFLKQRQRATVGFNSQNIWHSSVNGLNILGIDKDEVGPTQSSIYKRIQRLKACNNQPVFFLRSKGENLKRRQKPFLGSCLIVKCARPRGESLLPYDQRGRFQILVSHISIPTMQNNQTELDAPWFQR